MIKKIKITESDLIKMIGKIISESEEFEFQKLTNDEWEDIWMKLRKTSKSFGIPDNGIFTFGGLFFFYSKNGYLKLPPQKLSDWTDDLNRAAEILDDYVRRLKNIFKESSFDLKLEVGDDYSMRITMKDDDESETMLEQFESVKPRGKVKIVGNLDGEQTKNVNIMIDKLNELGITDPYAQIGVLAVIGGQSQFKPKNEGCHEGSSNSYLRSLFGDRLKKLSDAKLTELKKDCEDFFDYVYGKDAKFNWNTGNTEKGDGFKYRGRGFNQITFKHNYKKFGDAIGMDLVSDPDKLNDVNVAAEAAVKFYTINAKGKIPRFKNKEEAIDFFARINAGGGKSSSLDKSLKSGKRFEVEYTPFHLDKPKQKNKTKKEKFDWSSSFRWNS